MARKTNKSSDKILKAQVQEVFDKLGEQIKRLAEDRIRSQVEHAQHQAEFRGMMDSIRVGLGNMEEVS